MTDKLKAKRAATTRRGPAVVGYDRILSDVVSLLEAARRASARAVNAAMTASYWEIGRRIVEHEQRGASRAKYGEMLLELLAVDLTARFGRGFSRQNLQNMRLFYEAYPADRICQTLSGESGEDGIPICQTPSGQFSFRDLCKAFPLPWSH